MSKTGNKPAILLVEDDIDQQLLMAQLIMIEVQSLKNDRSLSDDQANKLNDLQILKVGDLLTLRKACHNFTNIIFSLLDCNIPDDKHSAPHDQFVKVKHRLTGQHKSVDLVGQCAPDSPITLTSSMDRFQRLVIRYYREHSELAIEFVSKRDTSKLSAAIGKHLKSFIASS